MYWSEASTLMPNAVARVVTISPLVPRTRSSMRLARARSMPVVSRTDPNVIAVMISHTVISMLAMPPPESSSSIAGLPDSRTYPA